MTIAHPYKSYLQAIEAEQSEMIETLIRWSDINSHTHNLPGLQRMIGLLGEAFEPLGGDQRVRPLAPYEVMDDQGKMTEHPLGEALHIRVRPGADLRVLLAIHMDTVYPPDHEFQTCTRLADGRIRGPGVTDAKGGALIMLTALKAFERSPWAEKVGYEVILNPDEEIGSPGSRPLLREAARRAHLGLVFEPALPGGDLAGARKGSGNFAVCVHGRSAHSGREFEQGRNAVSALASFIVALNRLPMSPESVTVNVAKVVGGGASNVVPDFALGRFNVRVFSDDDVNRFRQHLDRTVDEISSLDGISVDVSGDFSRPPKHLDDQTLRLTHDVLDCARSLGMDLSVKPSGGSCDGNNLVAEGLPTVDSLGAEGGAVHTPHEFIVPRSLTERAQMVALLIMRLAAGEIRPPERARVNADG